MVLIRIEPASGKASSLARGLPITLEFKDPEKTTIAAVKSSIQTRFPKVR